MEDLFRAISDSNRVLPRAGFLSGFHYAAVRIGYRNAAFSGVTMVYDKCSTYRIRNRWMILDY